MFDSIRQAVQLIRANPRLSMIMVSTVLVMAGQGALAPVLPLFSRSLGASAAAVGLTLSIFALARLLLNAPLGAISDRWGRRPLLVSGPLVSGIGMIGSGLAPDIFELCVWRFVAGAGSAMYMTGAQIYLADISSPRNRARVIGGNHAALLLGVSIGPALGGWLADLHGLRVVFFAVGGASATAALYATLYLPETLPGAAAGRTPRDEPSGPAPRSRAGSGWREMLTSQDFLAVSLLSASIFLSRAGGRMTLMPLLAATQFGYTPGKLGAVFTTMALINLVGILPAALIADRLGRKWAIVPNGLLIGVAFLLMASANSHPLFLGSALLLAIGTALIGPAPAAYAADIAPLEIRGLAMGLYRSAGDVGFVLGPVLLGALADATSVPWALAANALIMALAATCFGLSARETALPRGAEPDASEQPG